MAAEIVEIGTKDNPDNQKNLSGLGEYVLNLRDRWREYMETNYYKKWDEYNRLWRGQWAPEDSTRKSERAKIVTPALQQAVESSVAEIEEATFGRGEWFDLRDNKGDTQPEDIAVLREQLQEDFTRTKIRQKMAECILTGAVFGTGFAEVVLENVQKRTPTTEPMMDGQLSAFGVQITEMPTVDLRPVHPKNVLFDPEATSIDTAHGVMTDEFVGRHHVERLMREGVYKSCDLGDASTDTTIEVNPEIDVIPQTNRVRLTKYYGLVPRFLLEAEHLEADEEYADLVEDEDNKGDDAWDLVEAVVVIGNEGHILKAEESPFMMADRPLLAFAWDTVPGQLLGRGVCEKGYNAQKALDAEVRARIDALGLTSHPMVAMDASRMYKGHKPVIAPGRTILTNGNPGEIVQPFQVGQVSQITFHQAEALQDMVQAATGAVDSVGIAGQVNGEATAAGISMSLGAIIKRQKRTLVNFQESFLLPFVEKAAWRYMQFDPERYKVSDYSFVATSTLGIIAREYEVTQLTQLLQTMNPQSPAYTALIKATVDNMNLSNREELLAILTAAEQPSEEEQQRLARAQEAEMRKQEGQATMFEAQAAELMAQAEKHRAQASVVKYDAETDRIRAAAVHTNREDQSEADFERRLKIADLRLREQELNVKSREARGKLQIAAQSKTPSEGETS